MDRADGVFSLNPAPHASMRDVIKLADRAGRVLVSYTTAADGVGVLAVSAVFKLEIPQPPSQPVRKVWAPGALWVW